MLCLRPSDTASRAGMLCHRGLHVNEEEKNPEAIERL